MGDHVADWHFDSNVPNFNRQRLDSLAVELYKVYPEDMPYLEGTDGDITDHGNQSYNHNLSGRSNRLVRSISLNAVYEINSNLNLVGNFGLRDGERRYTNDEDGIGLDLLTGKWTDLGEQQSAELRLESMSNKRFSWLAGAYYYHMEESLDGPVFPKPLFFHIYAGIPMFLAREYDGVTVHPYGGGTTLSVGAFTSADYHFNEKITLTAGVRYSRDNVDFTYRQDGLPTFGYIHFPPDLDHDNKPDGYFDSTASWNAVTPNLSVKYAATPQTNLFGTISKGYKSGGFNLDYVSSWESVAIPFKPEFITNYELGIKTGNRRNTMYLNTAIFVMDYINMQQAIFQDIYEGYTISNAASALIKGTETEVSVRLLNNALTIMGGFGTIDAVFNVFRDNYFNGYWNEGEEYTDVNGNGQYDDEEPFVDMDSDFSGITISSFPKYTWNFLADFRLPVSSNVMFVSQLQADFIDEKQSQLSSRDEFNQLRDDARTLVDARVGFEMGPWSIFAWVKNMLNVEYINWTGQNGYIGVLEQDYGLPRRFGLRTSYRF
jgi:iron complex outermembrane receptor protein